MTDSQGMTRDRLTAHESRDDHPQRRRDALPVPGSAGASRPLGPGDPCSLPDPGLVRDLERLLGPERVLSRPIDRLGRSADASIYRLIPQAIVRPRGLDEVRDLLGRAHAGAAGT